MKDICLEDYFGMKARMWSYSASHDRLSIELSGNDERQFLVFYFCERVDLPWSWTICKPKITQDMDEKKCVFSDAEGSEEIRIVFLDAVILSVDEHYETYQN